MFQIAKRGFCTSETSEKSWDGTWQQTGKSMPHIKSTLWLRNLDDVFGQIDPVHRRAAIDALDRWTNRICSHADPGQGVS